MERLLTVSETAECLRISTRKLRDLTSSGQLPHLRIGRAVRFRQDAIAAYLDRLCTKAGAVVARQ